MMVGLAESVPSIQGRSPRMFFAVGFLGQTGLDFVLVLGWRRYGLDDSKANGAGISTSKSVASNHRCFIPMF